MTKDQRTLDIHFSQLKSIPNLLSLLRILLIPVFLSCYLTAQTPQEYLIASVILILSGLTDLLDGFIARHFHMITELGKVLDPVADKLTQLTTILCLTVQHHIFLLLLLFFVVKELLMLVGGAILMRRKIHPGSAKWFGKLTTCFFYLSMFALVLIPSLPSSVIVVVMIINILLFAFSLAMYIPVFFRLKKISTKEMPIA